MRLQDRICENADELLGSDLFREIVYLNIKNLQKHDSRLLEIFKDFRINDKNIDSMINCFITADGLAPNKRRIPASLPLTDERAVVRLA